VGIKPTLGLISRAGVIPIAHSQDTPGVMARTVRDAAILLGVLAAADPSDPATMNSTTSPSTDYVRFLNVEGLKGARLGIARQFFGYNSSVDRLMEGCISAMRRDGAEVVDPVTLPSQNQYSESELEVLLWEFKHDLNAYLRERSDSLRIKSLADVINFNEERRGEEMPYFEQEIMVRAQQKGPLTDQAYKDALAANLRFSRTEGIDAAIAKDNLDALVAATTGPAWLTDWINGDHESGSCSTPAAVAGYPHVTVPAGHIHGLPVGLSFFGPAWSEPKLLRLAYAFEQANAARAPPRFLTTAGFGS